MSTQKTKTINLSGIAKVTREMGDTLIDAFNKNEDLKVGQTALKAYNTSINASKTQIIYKKLTGKPKEIEGI